jgi:DNA-binding FadR family transcriptional regulator
MARLAARHRTKNELAKIESIHRQFVEAAADDVPLYKENNLDWHLAVARASANEPLIALMEAISRPARDAMDQQHVTTAELRMEAVKAHTAVLDAIRSRNEERAFRAMDRHVRAYRDIATKYVTDNV